MARSSSMLSCLLLLCCGLVLLGQISESFVNPTRATSAQSTALRAKSPGQPGYGGFGSIYGDAGGSSFSPSPASSPSPSPVSVSSSSGSAGGSIVADPNSYIIGFTAFFFASVYANAQGFFGPW
eukprot:TRINITY_DN1788_c0_g1_i4.p1 TRINITY_DN1788_c0_g1~~TRINITY_DN1788_c0_g1_i4.p1  ORF type:complete len:124 (-),score=27.12 TRINITY_DN1788_c0_g1_i4:300-671(-)